MSSPKLRLEHRVAGELADNPANWRRHPLRQREALADVLAEVGWAGALLYNEATGRLIDGHARKELRPDEEVPVLVGSWTEDEERKILATLDPLAGLAEIDEAAFRELRAQVSTDSPQIRALLDELAGIQTGGASVEIEEPDGCRPRRMK